METMIRVPARVLESVANGEIPDGAIAVYLVLAYHAGDSGKCSMSHEAIAEPLGLSKARVARYLLCLINAGLVRREVSEGGTTYVLPSDTWNFSERSGV